MSAIKWRHNVPKKEWGPRGWNWLHMVAISYPSNPTITDARATFRRIWNHAAGLPCPECKGHAVQYIINNPPDLKNTHALQAWVWKFHNAVNVRLKKPVMSFEDYLESYADEICWSSLPLGSCSMSQC